MKTAPDSLQHLRSMSKRTGVVLLVILGMLAVLALLGIAFVTFSAQEEHSSTIFEDNFRNRNADIRTDDLFLEALIQLVADTDNPLSAIRGHSLLRDLYGNDNDLGPGPDGRPGVAGVDDDGDGIIDNYTEIGWPGSDDRPNGVIDVYDFYQRAFNGPGDRGSMGPDGAPGAAGVDDDGNGVFDDISEIGWPGTDDAVIDFNFVFNKRRPERVVDRASGGEYSQGGFDEDYDYPDWNNMFLAAVRANGAVMVPSFHRPGYLAASDWVNVTGSAGVGRRIILRPRCGLGADGAPGRAGVDDDGNGVVDWYPGPDGMLGTADDIPDVNELNWPGSDDLEHPLFGPGTGPINRASLATAFTAISSNVYDVDNMGLGRPDSVWVDIGFPVQHTSDGRKFKPMIAYLVMDLDGKLNVNVHGNLTYDKIDNNNNFVYPNNAGDTTPDSHADIAPGQAHGAGAILPAGFTTDLPLGQGASVTEVNLQNLFSPLFTSIVSGSSPNEYRWLLEGQWRPGADNAFGTADDIFVPGRWGEPYLLPTANKPRAGATYQTGGTVPSDDNTPGYFVARGNVLEGAPNTAGGVHRLPADFDGNGVLATNANGRMWFLPDHPRLGWGGTAVGWPNSPTSLTRGHSTFPEGLDEAAEFNAYVSVSTDAAYTPLELETLYRVEDVDGSNLIRWFYGPDNNPNTPDDTFFPRLYNLAPTLFDFSNVANRRRRFMLTTESWDLARPSHGPGLSWATNTLGNGANLNRFGNGSFPFTDIEHFNATQRQQNLNFLTALPDAIRKGRRLDITPVFPCVGSPPNLPSAAKYEFAKSLYMVMWANGATNAGAAPMSALRARRLAQYCINVVDFIDTESGDDEVNTPFVYDMNPRNDASTPTDNNGWDVISDPTNTTTGAGDRGIVWGTEAPRVVISETFAYEDPPNVFNFWVELYNPSPFQVDLKGANQTYQLVISDRSPQMSGDQEGEPQTVPLASSLTFDNPGPGSTGGTILAPGQRMIVGAAGPIPANLGGGPFGNFGGATQTPPEGCRFVPSSSFNHPFSGPPFPREIPVAQFRVYLRKLANPYQPHSELGPPNVPNLNSANPYLTVDALDGYCHEPNSLIPNPMSVPPNQVQAYSLERQSLAVRNRRHDVGGPAPLDPTHSIGDEQTPTVPADDQFPFNSAASRDVDGVGGADPWPLFVFNDRPLMSPMELMLVPGVSPQHLTTAMVYPIPTATPLNPYTPDQVGQVNTTPLATGTACPTADLARPFREFGNDEFLFGYLLNFFRQVGDPSVPPYSLLPNPGYFRLFEYVEVPSRMNGARSGSMAFGNTSGRALNDREPGKLNINTIYEQPVFQAALNNHPFAMDKTDGAWISPLTQIPTYNPPGTTPVQWATSKTAGAPYADLNSELFRRVLLSISNPDANGGGVEPGGPRLFTANDRPFRGFDAGQSGTLSTIPSQTMPAPFTIQSTFLRGLSDPFLATAAVPVFEDNRTISPPGLTAPPNNQTDYPNYRWQLYQKMSNIFTTRSNVFAVWMTVGYFEVFNENPARLGPGIIAPPQLGGEFNADIGKNIRHRAFFVVDRSRARGYTGPPRNAAEIQDVLGEVVILSRILE